MGGLGRGKGVSVGKGGGGGGFTMYFPVWGGKWGVFDDSFYSFLAFEVPSRLSWKGFFCFIWSCGDDG